MTGYGGGGDAARTDIERARALLAGIARLAVLTGAGISAESGVPTFRGADGLWRHLRAEELATPQAFARDPRTVWEWYDWRRQRVAQAEPNAGHRALAEAERRGAHVAVITQNVDGLHRRAGSRRVYELHGSLWIVRCTACSAEREDRTAALPVLPPACPGCGGLERPGVVWFGELLPLRTFEDAVAEARAADALLVVGTSALVHPAAGIALDAIEAGRTVLEVNPEATPLSDAVTLALRGPAATILPALLLPSS